MFARPLHWRLLLLLKLLCATQAIDISQIEHLGLHGPILVDLILFGVNILGSSGDDIRSTPDDPTFAEDCFRNPKPNYVSPISSIPLMERTVYANDREELNCTGSFFPGRPYHSMVKDLLLSKSSQEVECCKQAKSPGNLGAGVLLFWCAEHRKCIGFVVLQSAEAPQHIYATVLSRFDPLPEVIIYDNGCNLAEHFLNRAPSAILNTMVLSDGFHWKNHINC
ncbi:hypothetical protein BC833DRAFT_640448, partial [Globomyces pollinis-pini]